MPGKARTIDEYLKPLSKENRAALEKLRKAIQAAAPGAEECISYDIPGFRWNGRLLASFGAWANHCAFYPGSTSSRESPARVTGAKPGKNSNREA